MDRIGKMGEDAVCQYLADRGHSILEQNWRTGHLEVDLITMDPAGIHFVEVKSRTAPVMAAPEEQVGSAKQKRITQAAGRYLSRKENAGLGEMEVHLDVASVVFCGGKVSIDYFEDAYIPIYV